MGVEERAILVLHMLVIFMRISMDGLLLASLAAQVEFLVMWSLAVFLALPIVCPPVALKIASSRGLLVVLVLIKFTVRSVVGLVIAILARLMVVLEMVMFIIFLVLVIVALLMAFLEILVVFMVVRALTEFLMFLIVGLLIAFVVALVLMM
ncbi:unnamed protein product [Prorocentrum cordatum]|uniref:Uncharacterized protein n=1 Tax=Prorocentrum cordatum TaxID=2364126 RepID=A0ABN9RWY1_9DINO|nr:unnamed protein product [Polarella glacialis]